MSDHVKFELIDYRQLDERFDRIVSVGMFEHVGARHYDEFFAKCRELLKPDGVMLLHTIGKLGEPPNAPDPFTDKWIFPGYHLPSLSADGHVEREGAADRQRRRDAAAALCLHAAPLARARDRGARAKIEAMYDARFFRMWEFYLAGGIVMFESGAACNLPGPIYPRPQRAADHARLHGGGRAALPRERRQRRVPLVRANAANCRDLV